MKAFFLLSTSAFIHLLTFFVFINPLIFSMVDFFFLKSVKVQTGVPPSKNLSVITLKHNDNGTVSTMAPAV